MKPCPAVVCFHWCKVHAHEDQFQRQRQAALGYEYHKQTRLALDFALSAGI